LSNVCVEANVRALMSTNTAALSPEEAGSRAHPAPVARFEGVSISRGDEARSPRGLSFALAPGSFHILAGAPGAGKTSILRLMCMADRPARGRIQIFGRDVASVSRTEAALMRRRIGVVFPELPLLEHLSVFENAALAPRLAGRKARDYAPQVTEVLRWVGLGRRADERPSSLSTGERGRLAIARAVANGPDMVLADEPTGELDAVSARRVLRLLAELAESGATVLMATRDEELAATSGAPMLYLHEGRLTLVEAAPSPAP
jgi:cell division transport system ATP-binding protein